MSYSVLLSMLVAVLAGAVPTAVSAQAVELGCVVDYRNPVPPDLLKTAGIRRVYTTVGIPLKKHKTAGKTVLDPKVKPALDEFFELYGKHGIKVLVTSHYYTKPPKGTGCIDFWGRTITMGCFNNEDFLNWMSQTIKKMAEVFGEYPAFGGFMFDDGVHVRVDSCYCEVCQQLFKKKHNVEPPAFEPCDDGPLLEADDPRLTWDVFHQEAYARYLRTQARAAASFSNDLFCATIPSDSYFYGRHLNRVMARKETTTRHNARVQRIDRIQLRAWHIFQSFPFPRVVEHGSGREVFGVGSHLTTPSPKMIMHTDGPRIEHKGRRQFLGPREIERLMRTTIAEGATAICFWGTAGIFAHYPNAFAAIGSTAEDMERAQAAIRERVVFPARVGLLYSTATEIIQQPWRQSTMERWRQLHAFEAMAYALTRASVQFRILFDHEMTKETLSEVDAVILSGVTHLSEPVAKMLEEAVAEKGLRLLCDSTSPRIAGAVVCEFDQDYWFNRQREGYRQVRHLDRQAEEIRSAVVPRLRLAERQPATVSGGSCFAKFFKGRDDSVLMFVVNWDTHNSSVAVVQFAEARTVRDEISGRNLGRGNSAEFKVEPAGWRVVRCCRAIQRASK